MCVFSENRNVGIENREQKHSRIQIPKYRIPMFITLEGPEGSGKTSHIPYLVEYLREKGYTVFPTREPGGTSIGEQIREVIHDLKNAEMHPRTETLLYQAARAQIVEQTIRPRLADGEIILSDRYADSTIAYQGYGHQQDIQTVPLVGFFLAF